MEKSILQDHKKIISLICGRAEVSKKERMLNDKKAESIAAELKAMGSIEKQSKYLSIFLAIRSMVLDEIAESFIRNYPDCIVLHLGCGLDTRCVRLKYKPALWVDLDFEEVIELRRNFYEESEQYKMIGSDAADPEWLDKLPGGKHALVIAEGFSMFMTADENLALFTAFMDKFDYTEYAFDAYTDRAILYSGSQSQPIVRGKTLLWGLSDPKLLENIDGVKYYKNYHFNYIRNIKSFDPITWLVYKFLYGKDSTNRYYRIYHFKISHGKPWEENDEI